jgi:hypothetical protein
MGSIIKPEETGEVYGAENDKHPHSGIGYACHTGFRRDFTQSCHNSGAAQRSASSRERRMD